MGITEVVNSALSQQTKSLSSISTSIQRGLDDYFAQLQPFFEDMNTFFASNITANNKRSELLWWKDSLYSRSLNASYRSLNPLNAAVCMALDLAKEVDAIYPESVDYLLRETLKDVHGEQAEEERLLTDWLKGQQQPARDIQSAFNELAARGDERKPLLNAWANVVQSVSPPIFSQKRVSTKKAKLTASDLGGVVVSRVASAKTGNR